MTLTNALSARDPGLAVHIIDDDEGVRQALRARLESHFLSIHVHGSAESFLEKMDLETCGCIVADLHLGSMSGIELLEHLRLSGCDLPVILISGFADVAVAVRGMKLGAVDFLQKPVEPAALIEAIQKAFQADETRRTAHARLSATQTRFSKLTCRELSVLQHVIGGESSKQIAHALGISVKTVSHHRANIMVKSGALNTADVVRLAQVAGIEARTQSALEVLAASG